MAGEVPGEVPGEEPSRLVSGLPADLGCGVPGDIELGAGVPCEVPGLGDGGVIEPVELVPGRYIGEGQPCFIIAEIGQNHQGDIDVAKKLIRRAKECGADCVKLQKSSLKDKFNQRALARSYESPHAWAPTYGAHKDHLEFSCEQVEELMEFAREEGIPLTASAMDIVSVDVLDGLGVPFIKIGSGDVHNLPLLRHAAATGRPLVVSTGMSDISWVSRVYEELTTTPTTLAATATPTTATPLVILQCTSAYPTPPEHVHLRVLDTYAQVFPRAHIGYSGHELGIHISVAAVARGARVIERHITLDKSWRGSDHGCSLEPHELRELVQAVRTVEAALGSPLKAFQPSEDPCYLKLGKTVVARRAIRAGDTLTKDDLVAKVAEPRGVHASRIDDLVGSCLCRDVEPDDSVLEEDVVVL